MEECLIILKALSASYTLPTHTFKRKTCQIIVACKAAGCLGRSLFWFIGVIPLKCVQYRKNSKSINNTTKKRAFISWMSADNIK